MISDARMGKFSLIITKDSPKWIMDLVSACAKEEIRRSEIVNGDSAEKLEYEIR